MPSKEANKNIPQIVIKVRVLNYAVFSDEFVYSISVSSLKFLEERLSWSNSSQNDPDDD